MISTVVWGAKGIDFILILWGLAPLPRESGHAGNARRRTALDLATRSAARYNPASRAFYTRLRAAGKPMQVARCAAARKLLHLAWALVTKRHYFDPTRQHQQPASLADQAA